MTLPCLFQSTRALTENVPLFDPAYITCDVFLTIDPDFTYSSFPAPTHNLYCFTLLFCLSSHSKLPAVLKQNSEKQACFEASRVIAFQT